MSCEPEVIDTREMGGGHVRRLFCKEHGQVACWHEYIYRPAPGMTINDEIALTWMAHKKAIEDSDKLSKRCIASFLDSTKDGHLL